MSGLVIGLVQPASVEHVKRASALFQEKFPNCQVLFIEGASFATPITDERDVVGAFLRHVATQAAYNGAGDKGQRFYDEGLNSWLYDVAQEFYRRTVEAGPDSWEWLGSNR